ncbi:MAG TPA: hypothetical protein VJV78_11720 [Polyangiales bacterium]|nr:hypothetical protein [Polyangiales bacterium]
MLDWLALTIGFAAVIGLVEVIRRMRRTSRQRLAGDLQRISDSLAELADELDSQRSEPARCAGLAELLAEIRSVLQGNSLIHGVRDDLIVGLALAYDEPSRYTAAQVHARKLTLAVEKQLQTGESSVETDKVRRVSGLFRGAAEALRAE